MKNQLSSIAGAPRLEEQTVSRKELLVGGSDRTFRRTIHTLMAITNNVDNLKNSFGQLMGITGPQHEIVMLIARANDGEGIGVGEVARLIKRTSAFVATETNQLQKIGLIEKIPSDEDKRRVLLRLSDAGQERLRELAPVQREVNNALFGDFDRTEFLAFIGYIEKLLLCSERACDIADALVRDEARRRIHQVATKAAGKRAGGVVKKAARGGTRAQP